MEFALLLEERYVDPATARRYASAVRSAAERGSYDAVGTDLLLAQALTRDVQAVAADGHLRVRRIQDERPGLEGLVSTPIREQATAPLEPAIGGPIEVARWLAPGVAYIRFTLFDSTPASVAAAEKFMQDHADADAVIFDLRFHRGGASGEMDVIFPYLFAETTPVMRGQVRASVATEYLAVLEKNRRIVPSSTDVIVEEQVISPHPRETRLRDAKVFVLVGGRTASAAEHFALALKASGRGVVIGETTAGAGNFALAGAIPLGSRFSTFIPVGTNYDPRGHVGWEGVGVVPNIEVPVDDALVVALEVIGLTNAQASQLSDEVRPPMPLRRRSPRPPAPSAERR